MVREDELLKEGLKETCSIFNLAVSGGKADLFARVKDKIDPTKFLDKLNECGVVSEARKPGGQRVTLCKAHTAAAATATVAAAAVLADVLACVRHAQAQRGSAQGVVPRV